MWNDITNHDSGMAALIILAIIFGAAVFVVGMGLLIMWIKYSLIRRNNSANYTGRDLTEKLFAQNGQSHDIKSSFFYAKYWNHNKRRGTYKLRPWTHNRKSLWTMMEASQQAYATIIRESNPKTFWMAFRLPQIVSLAGALIGFGFIAWGIYGVGLTTDLIDWNWGTWFKVSLGFSIALLALMYASIYRAYVLKKNVPPMLEGSGLSQEEIKIIKRIFNWALAYAVLNSILQLIKIAIDAKNENNGGSFSTWRR